MKTQTMESVFKSEEGQMLIRNYYRKLLESWPVENEKKTADTVFGPTHVILCGSEKKPPLFMIHGASGNSASWMGEVEKFSEHFRLIAVDMPGEPGLSADRRMSPSGDDYSLWAESLMNSLEIEKASFLGISLGSLVSLKFAVKNPGRVSGLSLLSTSGVAPARLSYLFKALPLMMMGKWGAVRNYRILSNGQNLPDEVFEFGSLVSKYYKPMLEPIPMLTDEELSSLTMPLQYFGGDHDAVLNTDATVERLKNCVPGSEINILNDTGHIITGVADRVVSFLKAV